MPQHSTGSGVATTGKKPLQVTVIPKFIEAGKVKQNEKAEELVSTERARETPEKINNKKTEINN